MVLLLEVMKVREISGMLSVCCSGSGSRGAWRGSYGFSVASPSPVFQTSNFELGQDFLRSSNDVAWFETRSRLDTSIKANCWKLGLLLGNRRVIFPSSDDEQASSLRGKDLHCFLCLLEIGPSIGDAVGREYGGRRFLSGSFSL